MIRTLAFGSAILSLLILAGLTVAGGLVYPDYNHLTQYISELGATGAVTGPAVRPAFVASGILLTLFWLLCIACCSAASFPAPLNAAWPIRRCMPFSTMCSAGSAIWPESPESA